MSATKVRSASLSPVCSVIPYVATAVGTKTEARTGPFENIPENIPPANWNCRSIRFAKP